MDDATTKAREMLCAGMEREAPSTCGLTECQGKPRCKMCSAWAAREAPEPVALPQPYIKAYGQTWQVSRDVWSEPQMRAALTTARQEGERAGRESAAHDVAAHVEQRLLTWRQRHMNKSGDRLALDDFMGQESIDDLVDFVCDEAAIRALPASPPADG